MAPREGSSSSSSEGVPDERSSTAEALPPRIPEEVLPPPFTADRSIETNASLRSVASFRSASSLARIRSEIALSSASTSSDASVIFPSACCWASGDASARRAAPSKGSNTSTLGSAFRKTEKRLFSEVPGSPAGSPPVGRHAASDNSKVFSSKVCVSCSPSLFSIISFSPRTVWGRTSSGRTSSSTSFGPPSLAAPWSCPACPDPWGLQGRALFSTSTSTQEAPPSSDVPLLDPGVDGPPPALFIISPANISPPPSPMLPIKLAQASSLGASSCSSFSFSCFKRSSVSSRCWASSCSRCSSRHIIACSSASRRSCSWG